ncbi:hypothetical protein B0J13DRAFT_622795 [Dactylonectria estremocensis]|uniref:Uncharacterized protein n=1 Tax=Dactylonectria estremocensis TaxID=1079267 RepID=A0A9P9EUP7_9HYPO|nr:hypothetical protein B0J13DRAFT_622795 [Dactylonectria estremocensis]
MEQQQLLSLRDELKNYLKPQEWGIQIQGAPQCVILMAQCKLLVSKPSAMALQLTGSGLKYDSLFANINHCTQLGQDTFRSTAVRMERVGHLAHEMSKPGGIIETMLKYIDPKQSSIRDKRFHSYVMTGLNTIDESVTMIRQVGREFTEWGTVTANLLRALEEKAASNTTRQIETKNTLEAQSLEKQRLEKELELEKKELEDLEKRFQKAIQTYEQIVNSLPATIVSAGAMVAAAAAVGLAPEVLAVGTAYGSMNYAWIWFRQNTRKSTIRTLDNETSSLRDRLEQLSGETKSINEVARIVKGTLADLNQLQVQIKLFMEFLENIQTMMAIIKDGKDRVFMKNLTLLDREELKRDTDLKKEILSDALLMKNRFLIASKAAALYNDVSRGFVIPGVRWVAELCIDSRDDSVEDKVKEIEMWRVKLCNGAKQLIAKRVGELDTELQVLNRESIRSFRTVAPELFEKVMGEVREMSDGDLK